MTAPRAPRAPRAIVFDAYGTLFDLASALPAAPTSEIPNPAALARLWREKQLQYTWLRSLAGQYVDFDQVTEHALDHALAALRLNPEAQSRARLLAAMCALTPYPEVSVVLLKLRAARMATAILSNGTPATLARLLGNAGLGQAFDHVLSADSVRAFKTDPSVYTLATATFAVPPGDLVFVSSNAWDAQAAAAFGFRVFWCNRAVMPAENLPGLPAHEAPTLESLPGWVAGLA